MNLEPETSIDFGGIDDKEDIMFLKKYNQIFQPAANYAANHALGDKIEVYLSQGHPIPAEIVGVSFEKSTDDGSETVWYDLKVWPYDPDEDSFSVLKHVRSTLLDNTEPTLIADNPLVEAIRRLQSERVRFNELNKRIVLTYSGTKSGVIE